MSPSSRLARRNLAALVTTALSLGLAGSAHAVLTNPSFETPTTTAAGNVLTNFPGFAGIWGPEVGSITTATMGVTPFAGSRMLQMTDDGLTYTQTFQAIDVTGYSGMINAGQAQLTASAWLNTNGGYTGAFGLVNVMYFSGSTWGSMTGNSGSGSLSLDANPLTWESVSVTSMIPVGTQWLVYQVAFQNASIGTNTGFVDLAGLDIVQVPAPGALALLGFVGLGARRRR
ncbi:MAG: hypothetical protein RLY21_2661 [Planctomycetota bacterium]|jgi:hypothetical protein